MVTATKCETHQFVRIGTRKDRTSGGNIIFRCAASNCFTTVDRRLLIGKESICNKCHATFILTIEDLKRSKPMCLNCSNTKQARKYQKVREVAANLFPAIKDNENGI